MLRREAAEWLGRSLPFPVTSFVELPAHYLATVWLRFDPSTVPGRVTLQIRAASCGTAGVIGEPRTVLRAAASVSVEMTPNRADNCCCCGLLAASETLLSGPSDRCTVPRSLVFICCRISGAQ